MKFKLNGMDRLVIPKLLPEKGAMLEQITIKELLEIIKIKTEEFNELGLMENKVNGQLSWDPEKIKVEKEFDLSKSQTSIMKDAVEKMDKDKEINQFNLETCQRIKKMR